jgi:iron complex transport system substrate-binding protein
MFLIAIAPDLLVSVASEYKGDNAKYVPANLAGLPVVGQFYGSDDLNYETIANIAPDVVIDVGEPKKTIVEDMDSITEKLAIPAVHVTADLRGTAEAFRTLGKLLGRESKGEELAAYCDNALSLVDAVMAQVGDNKARAIWALGDGGTNVMAKTSFHAEAFDLVADNVAIADEVSSKGSGNETDLEQIALWNPDVIIFAPDSAYSAAGTDPVWAELTAVKNGAYYEVPQGPYNWMGSPPSINRYIGMLWLTKLLYPQYASYDLQALTIEYYNLFYGYTLSADEYKALTANSVNSGLSADLTVAAAASLTDVMPKLAEAYNSLRPDVKFTWNFGSSGTLQTQIEEGAPADLFLSAGKKQVTALKDGGLLTDATIRNLLVNKVVLIVPAKSTADITSFEDVATDKVKIVAIGDEGVPVGQYTRDVYTTLGTLDAVLAKASLGKDVREVLTWVESGEADAGIVYATDAAIEPGVRVIAEAPEGSHTPIVYPGAVIKASTNQDAAADFLNFLAQPAARAIFAEFGFAAAE